MSVVVSRDPWKGQNEKVAAAQQLILVLTCAVSQDADDLVNPLAQLVRLKSVEGEGRTRDSTD